MRNAKEEIRQLLYAHIECIWVKTYEEASLIQDITDLLSEDEELCRLKLKLWSNTEGLSTVPVNGWQASDTDKKYAEIPSLFNAVSNTYANKENTLFIFRDLDKLIKEPKTIRYIRDFKEYNKWKCYVPFVVVSPHCEIPTELSKLFRVVDYDLPDEDMISAIVESANKKISSDEAKAKGYQPVNDAVLKSITNACLGLTANEIRMSLQECIIKRKTLDLQFLSENKIQSVKKTGILDYIVPKITLDDVGGHKLLKQWLIEAKDSLTPEAKAFGVDTVKGMMLTGIAGTGKTMIAEAFAGLLKYPLLSLSLSKILNRLVGESEKRIDSALNVVKSCSPCVLLLDETEKLLGGVISSNNVDGGITARIFQSILKFMQDNNDVFIILTANDISQLPPEFLRSGRIDTIWYFPLPSDEDREELLEIHFSKRNKNVGDNIISLAVNLSQNFTGAEIEQLVKNSIKHAFVRSKIDSNTEIVKSDIIHAAQDVTPVYKTSKEKILALETYCNGRARRTTEAENESDDFNSFSHTFEFK